MPAFTRKFVNDAGTKLEVDGYFRFASVNNIEITEYAACRWADREDAGASHVTLSDAEDFRLYEELMADKDTWEYDE